MMIPALPSGTVTFLFTDIEGSTHLWEEYPAAMGPALTQPEALLRAGIARHGGHVFKTMGDAFYAAFADPHGAVEAALACQRRLAALTLPAGGGSRSLRVRMALYTGPAEARDGDYFGPTLNRLARLLAVGHGGQVLVSGTTAARLGDRLPKGATLLHRGSHQLKDLQQPEPVFQLGHPELAAEFPPLRSLSAHPHNLPQQLTSFIGRERDIQAVKQQLAATRLLTLTGTGGTGKTRLSLQVAADLLEGYPDGAWLIDLAPLSEPALVPQAMAGALNLKEEAGRSLTQTLVEQLNPKQLLLLLDNCEHLVSAAGQLADAILRGCPRVRILATSREALRLDGETTYRVPSRSLPELRGAVTPAQRLSQAVPDSHELDHAIASLRQTLGEPAFEREYVAGQAMTIEAAIHAALQGSPGPDPAEPSDSE